MWYYHPLHCIDGVLRLMYMVILWTSLILIVDLSSSFKVTLGFLVASSWFLTWSLIFGHFVCYVLKIKKMDLTKTWLIYRILSQNCFDSLLFFIYIYSILQMLLTRATYIYFILTPEQLKVKVLAQASPPPSSILWVVLCRCMTCKY